MNGKIKDNGVEERRLQVIVSTLRIIFLLGLVIYFIFFVYNAFVTILHPYPIDYAEGISLDRVDKLSQGINVYHDISTYPYICCQYMPVAYLILAAFAKIFGASLALGRISSLVTSLLVGALIYKIVDEKTQGKYVAIVSSLLFFASPFTYVQGHVFGDIMTMGILFSLIGVYLLLKYEESKKVYLCLPFFLLAVYTKQPFIVAPVASFIYLFLKDKKTSITLAGVYAISGLFLFLLLNYLTGGQFYFHTIASNCWPYSILQLAYEYIRTIMIHIVLFAFAGSFVLYTTIKGGYREKHGIFIIYFVISALMALTVGKIGASAISYMLELVAVSCILFGFFFDRIKREIEGTTMIPVLVGGLLIFQLVAFAHAPYVADSAFSGSTTPTVEDKMVGEEVSSYVKNMSGKILSEDAGFVVINGKELLVDTTLVAQLYRVGLFDQSELVSDVQDREFSLILLKFDVESVTKHQRFTDEMLDAIRANYHLVEKIGENYMYEPNE